MAPPGNDPKELAALLEKMKKQNFFEILGLNRTADGAAVKTGYLKMARSYHPDTVPPGAAEALTRVKADIFGLISEANRTLSDPKLRADYLAEVEGGTAGEKVDVAQLLQAEELFQRGCVLVKARKFPEAVKALDEAIRANDREGEYFGWRGYAKYFTYEDKSKAQIEALKEITLSLKMNPNAAPVHYFLGFLYKTAGDLPKAKACFKKCVELDPRHIDAMREVRSMK
jgi:curved DNA-binding protein CbpA